MAEPDATPGAAGTALHKLREFFHSKLLPLAVRARAVSADEGVTDLLRDYQRPGLPPGRDEIIYTALAASVAHSLELDQPGSEGAAEYTGMAVAMAQYTHGYLSALAGERGNAMSTLGAAGAAALHENHRAARAAAVAWATAKRPDCTLDDLANEITQRFTFDRDKPIAFSTARKWLKGL